MCAVQIFYLESLKLDFICMIYILIILMFIIKILILLCLQLKERFH